MEQKRRLFAFLEEEYSMEEGRMDARSYPAARSVTEDPYRLSTGTGSGDKAIGELGQKIVQATIGKSLIDLSIVAKQADAQSASACFATILRSIRLF
jgi:hypothetical protein